MSTVKTAISLEKSLFEEMDALARQMKVSRSQLYSQALEEFIHRRESRKMLEQLNRVYENDPDPDEAKRIKASRRQMRRLIENDRDSTG